jgi:GMP synthase (glutamine-hydrolysing)
MASQLLDEILKNLKTNLDGKGILACSGGTDSSVLAVASKMAAGNDILSIFIDTGLLRYGERERVERFFTSFEINYKIVDESKTFLERLKGISDPETKRKVIGETFIRIFEREAIEFKAKYLLQGTIAPDWIESGGKNRDVIKSHHNVGGLPDKMNLKLIEPMRDLYKDDVRELSKELGLDTLVQPFPGPGLAVRIIGEITEKKLSILKAATKIVEESVDTKIPKKDRPWQYFAIMLPVKTTGVHGDKRSYGETIAIRSIDTNDGMTGTFHRFDWDFIEDLSTKITNEIPEVNRVVYDVTDKPPATIEWE